MFLGHHAAGLAAKRFAPGAPLAVLFAAAMLLDLIWPVLTLAGLEHVRVDPGNTAFTPLDFIDYPISHSLLSVLGWSLAAALLWWLVRRRNGRRALVEAAVVGAAVASHWVLDFVTHRPDLPLWPGGPRVGLGLWNSVPLTILAELALFAGGLALYVRMTEPRSRTGTVALAALAGFVLLVFAASIVSPPPPGGREVATVALAAWLFVPWSWWIDRNRRLRR